MQLKLSKIYSFKKCALKSALRRVTKKKKKWDNLLTKNIVLLKNLCFQWYALLIFLSWILHHSSVAKYLSSFFYYLLPCINLYYVSCNLHAVLDQCFNFLKLIFIVCSDFVMNLDVIGKKCTLWLHITHVKCPCEDKEPDRSHDWSLWVIFPDLNQHM